MKYMAQHDHGGRPQTLNFAAECVNLVFHNSLASSLTLVHLNTKQSRKIGTVYLLRLPAKSEQEMQCSTRKITVL